MGEQTHSGTLAEVPIFRVLLVIHSVFMNVISHGKNDFVCLYWCVAIGHGLLGSKERRMGSG